MTALVAALSLVAGFGVAELTGVRALGGLVLLAALACCAVRWARRSVPLAVALVVLYVAAFVASHLLADALGAWPSVLLVSAVVGGVVAAATRAGPGRPRP